MKNTIFPFIILLLISFQIKAQVENRSGLLNAKEQMIGFATGMDYAILPISLFYKRGIQALNYQYPISIGVDITVPVFSMDLNDIRIKLLTETTFLSRSNFEIRGGIHPVFINTKMQTQTMFSLGVDYHIFIGYTAEKWNIGAEATYNQIISTHIKHTDKYRENVFSEAVDGWYKNTAANIQLGIFANRSINNFNVFFRAGLSKTGQFNAYLFVPTYYANLGMSYQF